MRKIFFFGKKSDSGVEAGKRLRQVINKDRLNVSGNKTVEKIRREIIDVISKYSNEETAESGVRVSAVSGGECMLAVRIPLKINL